MSFGAPMTVVTGGLSLREEILGDLRSGHDRVLTVVVIPMAGATGRERSGEHRDRAVVSVVEGVWRFSN